MKNFAENEKPAEKANDHGNIDEKNPLPKQGI
jgi:hypothetical protein